MKWDYSISREKRQSNWVYWLLWVILNTFGWSTKLIVYLYVGSALNTLRQSIRWYRIYDAIQRELLIQWLVFLIIPAAIAGTSIGVLQQFVLRRLSKMEGYSWTLVTILGYALSDTLLFLQPLTSAITGTDTSYFFYRNPILGRASIFGAGFAIGATQWLVLRRYFTRSGLWPVATAIGFWFSLTPWSHQGDFQLIFWFFGPGLIFGAVTAIALAIISKQPEPVANLEQRLANLKESLTDLENQIARDKPERDRLDRQQQLLKKEIEHWNEEIARRRSIPRRHFWRN